MCRVRHSRVKRQSWGASAAWARLSARSIGNATGRWDAIWMINPQGSIPAAVSPIEGSRAPVLRAGCLPKLLHRRHRPATAQQRVLHCLHSSSQTHAGFLQARTGCDHLVEMLAPKVCCSRVIMNMYCTSGLIQLGQRLAPAQSPYCSGHCTPQNGKAHTTADPVSQP